MEVCDGTSITLSSSSAGTNGTYKWFKNGNFTNQTSQSIVITQDGVYTVEISNGSCAASSHPKHYYSYPKPTATISVTNNITSVCER